MAERPGWSRDVAPVDYLLHRADSDPKTRSTMMSIELLETRPDWARLRDDFERASRAVPRLRQKVVAPLLPLGPPQWAGDPDFDLGYHLRRVSLPEPGTRRQLLDLALSLYAGPLDPGRPLWEATLVEGVDFGGASAALLFKLSHSVTDGVGGIEMDKQIRSYEPFPDRGPMPPPPVADDVGPAALTVRHARRLPAGASSGARAAVTTARRPLATARDLTALAASLRRSIGPPPAAPSPLLRRRSLGRRFTTVAVPFADLRGAATKHGRSVNDAYLAALCGAMRLYHEAQGVPIDALPLAIPVSSRTTADPAGGNRWAPLRIAAPVGEPDPASRMATIHELVVAGRRDSALRALSALAPLLALLPAALVSALVAPAAGSDVQASNVAGHARPTYIGGARVLELLPFGPLPTASAMMAVLLSHAGTCHLGVQYDTASFTDGDLLDRCLAGGLTEVVGTPCVAFNR